MSYLSSYTKEWRSAARGCGQQIEGHESFLVTSGFSSRYRSFLWQTVYITLIPLQKDPVMFATFHNIFRNVIYFGPKVNVKSRNPYPNV